MTENILEKSLKALLEHRKKEYIRITTIYLLDYIDSCVLDRIENEKCNDIDLKSYYKNIKNKLLEPNPSEAQYIQLFNEYSEAEIYLCLKNKLKNIKKIPEKSTCTPDFECSVEINDNGSVYFKEFFIEFKTFNIINAEYHMRDIAYESLEKNIEMDYQLNKLKEEKKSGIVFYEHEISPFRKESSKNPILTVIETLIEKMKQNYKEDQYKCGLTIPVYNLSLLSPPLDDGDLSPVLQEQDNIRSGMLWNAVFGKCDNIIYGWESFKGAGNIEGYQKKEGFLNSHKKIPACIFFNRYGQNIGQFYGLYNSCYDIDGVNNKDLENILSIITDGIYNNQKNTRPYFSITP